MQYIFNLKCGEALREFLTLCVNIRDTNTTNLNQILLGLGTYFLPINEFLKQNFGLHHGMRNTQ